jgi:hypothetical protein
MTSRRAKRNFVQRPLTEGAIVVRPGDTLIVRVKENVSLAELAEVRRALGEQLPNQLPNIKVVVIPAAEQILIYRPGAKAPPTPLDPEPHSTTNQEFWYF